LLGLGSDSIQFAAPPEKVALDDVSDLVGKRELVSAIYQTIQAGRNLRAESKLSSNKKIHFILRADDKSISSHISTLTRLLKAEKVELDPKYQAQAGNRVVAFLGQRGAPPGDVGVFGCRAGRRWVAELAKARVEIVELSRARRDEFVGGRADAAIDRLPRRAGHPQRGCRSPGDPAS